MRPRRSDNRERVTAEAEVSLEHQKALANALMQTRKAAGLTQQELAQAMQTTQSTIADLERGRTLPSTRTLRKFAEATGHSLHVRFVQQPQSVVPRRASHAMTDTLFGPSRFLRNHANRRHVLGGAMGMAGLLGLGKVAYVSAEEATAIASASADYVWTPPQYDPEPALFTVVDRNDETVTVETIDGLIEIPANPQRIVSLGLEYISLFELGLADRIIAATYTDHGGSTESRKDASSLLWNAGDLTEDMHAALANVELMLMGHGGADLDIEKVVELKPDLILTSPLFSEQDPAVLSKIAPVIRGTTHTPFVPRSAVRDFGTLFGLEDAAAELLAQHETYIERARETVAPVVEGKKAGIIVYYPETGDCYAYPSYYIENGGVFTTVEGAYQLHRELNITPSSFIEHLGDENGRETYYAQFSMEDIGSIDLDHIFIYDVAGGYDAFVETPLVQQTVAGKSNQIYAYDPPYYGFGLAGVRGAVAWMTEMLTGEPFE